MWESAEANAAHELAKRERQKAQPYLEALREQIPVSGVSEDILLALVSIGTTGRQKAEGGRYFVEVNSGEWVDVGEYVEPKLTELKSKLNGTVPTGRRMKVGDGCWLEVEGGEWIDIGDWEEFSDVGHYEDFFPNKKSPKQ